MVRSKFKDEHPFGRFSLLLELASLITEPPPICLRNLLETLYTTVPPATDWPNYVSVREAQG